MEVGMVGVEVHVACCRWSVRCHIWYGQFNCTSQRMGVIVEKRQR